ncbi:MAG TPA: universal stress protein [Acidimicrobiia bacterium]|nr:universal stress protein [Acidimicrobiia bacterium]
MQLILVGDDGSRAASHAVTWATRLADERDARLFIVHVASTSESVESDDRVERITVRDSHPASAIMETAEDRDVDLIVLGRRGRGGFPSLPIGTTAHHVAAASGRPVAVVPPIETTTSGPVVQRAVVGIDGFPGSEEAAAWSARQWPHAHFNAVQAVELAPAFAQLDDGTGAEIYERAHARAVTLLRDRWSRPLVEAGVAFDLAVEDGGPAEVLLEVATKVGADVIVVGRRDHAPLRGTLGGVSQRVLAYAPCAAVIVPPPSSPG